VRRGIVIAIVLACVSAHAVAKPKRASSRAKHVIAEVESEPRRTTQATAIRKQPRPRAAVVAKLAANVVVVVDREEGDWLRVRARIDHRRRTKEVIGYVVRAAVSAPVAAAAPPIVEDTTTEEGFVAPSKASEPRKTIDAVVVRKKPGEKQASAGTLRAGTTVVVEGEKGRWLRVRAGKITGYLARTSVTGPSPATDTSAFQHAAPTAPPQPPAPAGDELKPAKGWRAARRPDPKGPITTELFVEVTAVDAVLRAEPSAEAMTIADVSRGTRLIAVDAKEVPGWVRARDDRGFGGWIPRTQLGNGAAAVALTGATAEDMQLRRADSPAPGPTGKLAARRAFAIRIDAGVGYRVLGMDFTSNGSDGLANYLVTAAASAADVELDVTARPSRRLVLGLDTRVGASRGSPIDYPGPSGPSGKIPFSTSQADAGIRAGFHAQRMFEVTARLGGHYDAWIARDVENAGMLPRERLLGATLGARVDIAPPRSRVSATLHVDALAAGSRAQTTGLEDGAASTARALWAGMTVRIQLARHLSLLSAYDLGRATTEWTGMSVREPGVTAARRVDSTQLMQIGLSAEM
jgi:SH3-like domain-containing protein